jgi:transcriptional regulator with XRE-family HTH domain
VSKISGRINQQEREIAARVRKVRKDLWLSIPKFAAALGETLDRMASIEYGRTPLTVAVADKLADEFDINLKWLKTGNGKKVPGIGTFSVFAPEIRRSILLSIADTASIEEKHSELLKYNYLGMEARIYKAVRLPKGEKQKVLVAGFHGYFDEAFNLLPQEGREKLLALCHCTIEQFEHDWYNGERETPGQNLSMEPLVIPRGKKFDLFKLTDKATSAKDEAVQNQWHRLKARIQKATENPGGKSMLAKFLGVDLTQLSKWLTDSQKSAREPGADYTLKMLQWVEAQERK